MATVDEIVRDLLASAATDAGAPAAAKWVDNRYREMVSKVKFRHLRQVGELHIPAVIDSGTVTVTRGSTAVAGVSTTFETDVGSSTQQYYYFRASSTWYKIASITDETNLVLTSEFAEDDVSAGSYKIVKRYHPLDSNARWVGDFYNTRLRYGLEEVSLDSLNTMFPGRILVGSQPTHVAQVGVNSSNVPMVEIYPPPEESELLHYIYWSLPTALTFSSTIPAIIDAYTLKEGALIDLYRFNKVFEIGQGNVERAAIFANEEAKQRRIWERAIKDAIRTSRAADDMSLILQMFHGKTKRSHEQKTAHDYVLDNWRS